MKARIRIAFWLWMVVGSFSIAVTVETIGGWLLMSAVSMVNTCALLEAIENAGFVRVRSPR